jgi:hypothetical protein
MVDGIVFLISVAIAAVCGAIWGLWRGEKNNEWLKRKNEYLNRALESELKANESLKRWLRYYRDRENVRS